MDKIINPKSKVNGLLDVPGDKSISHRAIMFSSIANGETEIEGFLNGEDCIATIDCFRSLGVKIETETDKVKVFGKGLQGLSRPDKTLYAGNSGTTIRLISGILSAQSFSSEITGDSSLQKRPMGRIINPLRQMGAKISALEDKFAPLSFDASKLNNISYELPVASAQIKSAILLAGLYAEGETVVTEPLPTRDHSEIMLKLLGADINKIKNKIFIRGGKELRSQKILIPGDISSAAYFLVAGLIIPNSSVIITNVGVNFTRTGILTALREMGADIKILNRRNMCGEAVADLEVISSRLHGITISGAIIPRMIDEIPVLAVAALFAEGTTIVKDARELKVKESNRISAMANELRKMGAKIEETEDGMIIEGGHPIRGAAVDSHTDHRVAMSLAVAGLAAEGESCISAAECVDISFPNFFEYIENL